MAVIANLNNSITTFAIRAGQGHIARTSLRKATGNPVYREFHQDMHMDDGSASRNEVLAIAFTAYTIQRYMESGMKGAFTIIVPDSVAIRMFEARKVLNNGGNAESVYGKLVKKFMDEDFRGSISDLAEQLEALHAHDDLGLKVIKASNLTGWNVTTAQEDVELAPGMQVTFKDGVSTDGTIELDNNRISGTFELKVRQTFNPETGEATEHYYVDRVGNSVALRNARTLWENAGKLLPQEIALEDMDLSEIAAGEGEF